MSKLNDRRLPNIATQPGFLAADLENVETIKVRFRMERRNITPIHKDGK